MAQKTAAVVALLMVSWQATKAAVAIALLTVSWQAIRAALANPVDSLRDE